MPLTFLQAKTILAKYDGKGGSCVDAPSVPFFVKKVLQHMLISGAYGNIRTFVFCAVKGCFTVPYELEVPLKVKINDCIGSVWDKWFEFHSSKYMGECVPAANSIIEDPNEYPTVYDLPNGGSRVGIIGVCVEEGAYIIVQGIDPTGREIFTTDSEGNQIVGEKLRIIKGKLLYTQCTFGKITGIVKTSTNGYSTLFWVNPNQNTKGFLADYSPLETNPSYRRFKVTSPNCGPIVKVMIMGRIRLKSEYTDNDYIPFDNIYTIDLAGQTVNANANKAPDLAGAANTQMVNEINLENEYKRVENGQPMEVWIPLSGGAVRNII